MMLLLLLMPLIQHHFDGGFEGAICRMCEICSESSKCDEFFVVNVVSVGLTFGNFNDISADGSAKDAASWGRRV